MKLSDFEIHSRDKLDAILAKCCSEVLAKQKEDSDYWGMVGACLLDNKNRAVYGVNHKVNGELRDHAEVVAIKNYLKKYGTEALDGAIIITTLSPCSSDIDQPNHRNCTDYINEQGIKKVYCGFKDPSQLDTEVYRHKKFHLAETRNKKLRHLCVKLASTFLDL
jgi:pyrimidine deaminase RibD-like protein